jgi:hypothetical protein
MPVAAPPRLCCAVPQHPEPGMTEQSGEMPKASCLSHFKSRFFNLREALGASRTGSLKGWQDMDMSKDYGRSPYFVRANAHNGLAAVAVPKPTVRTARPHAEHLAQEEASSGKIVMKDHVFSMCCKFLPLPRGALFGKVVVHRYRGTVESITLGASFIGNNTSLQMPEIPRVLRYRRFSHGCCR